MMQSQKKIFLKNAISHKLYSPLQQMYENIDELLIEKYYLSLTTNKIEHKILFYAYTLFFKAKSSV